MIYYTPENPGAYFEARCKHANCSMKHHKVYLYIGTNMTFDYFHESSKIMCPYCKILNLSINNIGLLSCKWTFKGELDNSTLLTESPQFSPGYQICQNLKQKKWKWLQFTISSLEPQEIQDMQKILNNNLDFDQNMSDLQLNSQSSSRFNEKNKQNLKKEAERKRDIIYYLKKNLKDQQKIIKKLSKKRKKEENCQESEN